MGLFSIFTGYDNANGTADPAVRSSDELNSIFLGFSRDVRSSHPLTVCSASASLRISATQGFHWWRQYSGDVAEGGTNPRRPFMENAWPVHLWNRADVQSVGGGFVVVGDEMRFYSSGSKDLPYGAPTAHYHSRGNRSMGMAVLRRDGMVSVENLLAEPGVLTTRPLVWNAAQRRLFVNAVVQPGGFLQVEVLINASTGWRVADGLGWNTSTVGDIEPNTCVEPGSAPFDSTRAAVSWTDVPDLGAVAGDVVKLRFRLSGASLYSFWLSATRCGESGGFLAAGGPGSVQGRDEKGSCK